MQEGNLFSSGAYITHCIRMGCSFETMPVNAETLCMPRFDKLGEREPVRGLYLARQTLQLLQPVGVCSLSEQHSWKLVQVRTILTDL